MLHFERELLDEAQRKPPLDSGMSHSVCAPASSEKQLHMDASALDLLSGAQERRPPTFAAVGFMSSGKQSSQVQVLKEHGTAVEDEIAGLLLRLYEVISFPEDGEPDWQGMSEVFSPHARITRVTPEGTDYFDLPTFQAMAHELLRVGAYTAFHEREVACRVERFGNVAHVTSAYETRRNPAARACLGRGINSLQLVRENDTWRVLSLCWDEEALRDSDVRALVGGGNHG